MAILKCAVSYGLFFVKSLLFGILAGALGGLVCVVSFVLSGKSGLYVSRVMQFGDPLKEDVSSA